MTWRQDSLTSFRELREEFGVPVTWGVMDARVLFAEPTQGVLGDMQLSDDPAMEYDPADLPELKRACVVVIDGSPYTVREITKSEDGFTRHATLKTA